MALHVLTSPRRAALGQALGANPSPAQFAGILKASGFREGIPILRRVVLQWNIATADPGAQERVTQGIVAAGIAADLGARVKKLLDGMIARFDDTWTGVLLGAIPLLDSVRLRRILKDTSDRLGERVPELYEYTRARPSLARIQRSIIIMFDEIELALVVVDRVKGSFTTKLLQAATATLDTAISLYEAILALLRGVAAAVKTLGWLLPVFLVGAAGLLFWWLAGKATGPKEAPRAA